MNKRGDYKVIDDYFPDWLVTNVSYYLKTFPVTYTNTPNKNTYKNARFMGNMIMIEDEWMVPIKPSWFIEYFNHCIYNDLLKEYDIKHCLRCLHNGQFPLEKMNGINHRDADDENYVSVIYMGHGNSGDTVIVDENEDDVERISFKEGRIVMLNSFTKHRGEAPKEGYRVSWGFVYPLFTPIELTETQKLDWRMR